MRDILREEWVRLLDSFSDQFQGKRARLEVVGTGGKQHVITESLPFSGISADLKDGEDSVSIILDTQDGGSTTHIVDGVKRVQIDDLNGDVSRIEIEGGDGDTTVLSLH